MSAVVHEGTVIFRAWDQAEGMYEGDYIFSSLDELFHLCLGIANPMVVDRIILRGTDEQGEMRTVVLTFQSASGPDESA